MDREAASLARVLEVERDCCADLARILEAERRAVAEHDLGGLLGAVKEREAVQLRWQRAAATRAACLEESDGAAALAGHSEIAPLLAGVRAAATEVRRAQRINAAIVRGALAQVSDLLATLRRSQPSSRYDGRAALTAPLPSASPAGWRA